MKQRFFACKTVVAVLVALLSGNHVRSQSAANVTESTSALSAPNTTSSLEVELELTPSSEQQPSAEAAGGGGSSFLDKIGLRKLQQKIEEALRSGGQRWQELKPRFTQLANDLRNMMTNRTAIIETIERFSNSTGIMVRIRDKINEASKDG